MNVIDFYPNQDPKIIELYEIIGSYFTDIIFNHIYINTKTRLTKEVSFIDEYIRRLQLYMLGIKNDPKCYNTVICELHKYYTNVSSDAITLNTFIDKIVKTCVPSSFIKELTLEHSKEIVSNIICYLITNMVIYASSPEMIVCIINNHLVNAKTTIRKLQDYAIQTMITKKINILNKFVKEAGQIVENDTSHIDIINDLKQNISKLLKDKYDLINIIKNLEELNVQQKERILDLTNKELKLRKLILLLNHSKKVNKPESSQLQQDEERPRLVEEWQPPSVEKEEQSRLVEEERAPSVEEEERLPSVEEEERLPSVEKEEQPLLVEERLPPSVEKEEQPQSVEEKEKQSRRSAQKKQKSTIPHIFKIEDDSEDSDDTD
jgi:hypothetical protein